MTPTERRRPPRLPVPPGRARRLALTWLSANEARAAEKKPHFPAKAKSVLFLFMVGGPSPLDLFDPKPELEKWRGSRSRSVGKFPSQFTKGTRTSLPSTDVQATRQERAVVSD